MAFALVCSHTAFGRLSLEEAIKAMKDVGIGECELFSGHVEPRPQPLPGAPRPAQGQPSGPPTPEMREAMQRRQEEVKKWRLSVPLDHFKVGPQAIR